MGTGKERKEVTAMKRLAILLTVFVFMTGTVIFIPPVVYADETYYTYDDIYSEEYVEPITKDTSWFNHEKPKSTYKIKNESQLLGLASLINETQIDMYKPNRLEHFEGVTFVLATDITLTQRWQPIGTGTSSYFAGTFDGNGHAIKGLNIESNGGDAGLFGYLTGEVKNLRVEGKIKNTGGKTGSIVGELASTGKVTNCVADVKVTGSSMTGGIAGFNNCGAIESCVNYGDITGTFKVGGVVGENWGGSIYKSGNRGNIKSTERGVATYGTGGVAGRSVSTESIIDECYNCGNIVSNTEATGGVVGYCNAAGASITNSYNNALITITNDKKAAIKTYVGGVAGIVGSKGIKIVNCYSVKGIEGGDVTGGIIGKYYNDPDDKYNENLIKDNYYVKKHYKNNIGTFKENAKYIEDAGESVSAGSLGRMSHTLGSSYKKDSSGKFGNNGFPVLKWQEPPEDGKAVFLKASPETIQLKIDQFTKSIDKKDPAKKYKGFLRPDSHIKNIVILNELEEDTEKE